MKLPCLLCNSPDEHAICSFCEPLLPQIMQHCQYCHRGVLPYRASCPTCLEQPGELKFYIPFAYAPPLTAVMHAFKFGRQEIWARFLAALWCKHRGPESPLPEALIPVASHPRRLWERGFNPAQLLAQAIGQQLQIPVYPKLVKRHRYETPQRGQSQKVRRKNVHDAFAWQAQHHFSFQHIALVDDVVTTGETLRALALTVQPHVKQVEAWAIAESVGI